MSAGVAVAHLQREQCLSMGGRHRKSSASVSAPVGMLAAHGTLSRSLAVYHRDQMQANAVSQRAAWVLLPRPLNYRLSDAASTHVAPGNGGASVLGVVVVYEASGTLSSSFALRDCAWMLANTMSQRAAVLRSLNYRVSNAVSTHDAPKLVVHLFRGQLGCLKHRRHPAAAFRCGIMLGCRPLLCRREQRGCWCRRR